MATVDSTEKVLPKLSRFAANIAALTERTRLAREELEKMCDVTSQLREQCTLQEKETASLEKEQVAARSEVETMKKRIELLSAEKVKIEAKLEELRAENAKLDLAEVHAIKECGDSGIISKIEIYSLLWKDVDLSKFIVSAATYGGPIALIRNDRKLFALHNQASKPILYLYTSSGKLINQVQWEKGRIVAIGWTRSEHLVCVLDNGLVRLYDLFEDVVQFSLGQDAKEHGVIDCQIWDEGLVALTGNLKFVVVNDFTEPRPKNLADPALTAPPLSWCIIPPQFTLSRHVEVFVSVNNTILVLDATNVKDQGLNQGPFTTMSVSPNGKFLSLFTREGKLWVVSTDFQKSLAEFPTNSNVPPVQMAWCGTDSVVLHWEDTLLVIGPYGDWIKYTCEGVAHLVSEIDGVRIITSDKCFFLQRVPTSTEEVFSIGSTGSGAILFDSFEHFERKSPRAEENIRNIKADLHVAIDTCLDAAANEFNSLRQKSLLKAASFGKHFAEFYDAEKFVKMCSTIRILNAARHYEVGMPLTFTQFLRLTPEVLIGRLVARHHHLLALRICEFLKIKNDKVLVHWACAKVKRSGADSDTVCRVIAEKLGGKKSNISFAEIAKTAYQYGHTRLATELLEFESKASNQVPLLMSMDQDDRALIKAMESCDTDLVHAVILHIKRKLALGDFFRLLQGKPLALNLVESYAKQQDLQLLKDYYFQDDRKTDSANVVLLENYEQSVGISFDFYWVQRLTVGYFQHFQARISKLRETAKFYKEDKDRAFEYSAITDQITLLQHQANFEKDTGQKFMDLTVSQTIFKCFILGHDNKASLVIRDMKVRKERWPWLKVQALVEQRNFEGLDKFMASVSKVITIGAVIEILVKANELHQAKLYAERLAKTPQGAQEANTFLTLIHNMKP
ncbi:hypothetical protein HDU76_000757 [Blyttiomyces sp. JEL0837]|nr:hypothetical protein HDU76_000757 [Blyttiomyces sp. JEL0837]